MSDSTPPRPIESLEPPAIDEGAARSLRRSRHQLRLPNDLTRMEAPDTVPPAEASAASPADGATIPAAPAATDLHPQMFESEAPPAADVEVTLDTSTTVSVMPPPPAASPATSGAMRVVRRRVRTLGDDSTPASVAPPAFDTAVEPSLARLPDLGLDYGAPSRASVPPAEPEAPPADAPPRLVTPPPMAAIRIEDAVPKRPSTPPPRRPSNPPPAAPSPASNAPAPTTAAAPPTPPSSPAAPVPSVVPAASPSSTPPAPTVPAAPLPSVPVSSAPPVSLTPVSLTPVSLQPSTPASVPPLPSPPPVPAIVAPPAAPPPVPAAALPRVSQVPSTRAELAAMAGGEFAAAEAPATSPAAGDDEGVEISLDEHGEGNVPMTMSQLPQGIDPSLALLDELAEMGHATPVESVDAEAVEHIESLVPRGASMPPPPPSDAARKTRGNVAPSKIAGGPTQPDVRPKRRRMWWEELFNEDYFRTIERLTPAQVQAEADWIEHALGVEAGASILDVGCGAGRQAIALAQRRYEVSAVDLSMAMLTRAAEAAQEANARVAFTQCDMAAMEFHEQFDAAYCVGSTFGFFDDPRNGEVARRIHRSLKPHGTLLLGVLNRDHVIQHQPAMSWFEGDGCVCMEESGLNFITSRLNVKRTMIYDDGRQREFEYSLRLYSLHELGQVLHEAGFRILEVSGSARTPGAFFGPSSRELIILAQKRAPEVVDIGEQGAGESTRP